MKLGDAGMTDRGRDVVRRIGFATTEADVESITLEVEWAKAMATKFTLADEFGMLRALGMNPALRLLVREKHLKQACQLAVDEAQYVDALEVITCSYRLRPNDDKRGIVAQLQRILGISRKAPS